jgi:dTDP-4-amino-4,6-dideoxygalactose transaminase
VIALASPLAQYRAHEEDIRAAVARVLEGGNYILGPEVESFERAFAAYCETTHAIGVANGTDALRLALMALDIGADDEVITVSHTAVATAAAILATGATPVFVDIDPVYYCIDPARIEAAITPRTKAIIPVHLYGQSADMDAIRQIAQRHGLRIAEDCAQSAGAVYRGRRLGSIGDIGCFSFYPTKNLGAIGDGGMIVTSDVVLAGRVRRLRQYGWDDARVTHEMGLNSRLDPMQAAILGAKLPHLDSDNARRVAIARRYAQGLAGLPITVPAPRRDAAHVYHLYVSACDERDALIAHLAKHGVGCGIHYSAPVHQQKGYGERAVFPPGGLPITEQLVSRIVSLPMYPELTDTEVDVSVAAVRECLAA